MTTSVPESVKSTAWLGEELAQLERDGLRRVRRTVTPLPQGECEVDGRRLVNFASNDYLGLAGDERLREAARRAIATDGVGAGASPLVTGRTVWHERLERRIAELEGTDAAVLFPTGYAANAGTISTLVGRGDIIFSDEYNHASLIDGCRLSRATVCVYPHADVDSLAEQLQQQGFGRRLIVTDGVFSMDGDIAPLRELSQLAEKYDCMLLVDEAHATGVMGEHGRGACELAGVESTHVIRVGTLSKGLGAVGGFVAGSKELVDFLWHRARTQVFSTSLPPSICAAALEAIGIIQEEPERRVALSARVLQLRLPLARAGLLASQTEVTPIVPIVIGDPQETMSVARVLEDNGLLVGAIRPPTVPIGTSRLRISLSAAHSEAVVDRLLSTLLRTLPSHHV